MDEQRIWDITPLVTSTFPLWPQSVPLTREVVADLNAGDVVTSSVITATAHLGAHADAPSHYAKGGKAIHECDLHHYLGLCQVIRPKVKRGQPITKQAVTQIITAPRVLFATETFDFNQPFREDFSSFDPEFFEWMAHQKVITVGIDGPSVDMYQAADLPCHHLAFRYQMALLENLDLKGVPEGVYELIALPLKIKDFDASPVRAILRELPKA